MIPRYHFTIGIDGSGIDEMRRGLLEYKNWLNDRSKALLERLEQEGIDVAKAEFASAEYDGTNDVEVSFERRDDRTIAVVALGMASLFIEFGTGVKFPDGHPEMGAAKAQGVSGRGDYGHKLGRLKGGWRYPEEHGAGSHGQKDPKHPGYIHTYGNPANAPMYHSAKNLRDRFREIVKEVFV